jgi:hypothetical protein
MQLPRFNTLQLLLVTTLAALLAGLFMSAWEWHPVWVLTGVVESMPTVIDANGALEITTVERWYTDAIPLSKRGTPIAFFIASFVIWAGIWGMVRKRSRGSFAKKDAHQWMSDPLQKLPPSAAPLAMTACWGLMIVGGIVALGIPIVLMFTLGPWLFPTLYFSLFVGLAAVARGAARDSINLKRTAALQLANMIALDPANVVFAAMELALLRSRSVRDYLGAENR